MSRKEVGRWLVSIKDSFDISIQRVEGYTKERGGRLITATRNKRTQTSTEQKKKNKKKREGKNRKIKTVWTFQATNKWNLTGENLEMAKKRQPLRGKLNLF